MKQRLLKILIIAVAVVFTAQACNLGGGGAGRGQRGDRGEKSNYIESKREGFEKDAAEEVKRIVTENRADLTAVERTVIEHRFGLERGEEKPMTLEQVGQIIGVTKERVRQIQNKAMEKIRVTLEESFLGSKDKEEQAEGSEAGSETRSTVAVD